MLKVLAEWQAAQRKSFGERWLPLLIVLLVVLAVPLRLQLMTTGFPVGDGGFFFKIVETILSSGYHWPSTIQYNGETVPFAYPPLGFYLTAALSKWLSLPPLQVMRFMPVMFNLLTVALFVLIAARTLNSAKARFFASLLFPLTIRSYEWTIMGGGISRSPGFFLLLWLLM